MRRSPCALNAYGRTAIRFVDVDLAVALKLCSQLRIYAYDAYLIACAQAQRCPLLTLDQGLTRAAKAMGVEVVED
ncbi:MAG: type II toxin-antitoxin system VapC family toxin [Gammaproteobacteria bacterium]